jgi:protoheme IX farnesyltransferase
MNSASEAMEIPGGLVPAAAVAGAPGRARVFYELIKPRMNLLVLGTTAVGYDMAAQWGPDWRRLPQTLLGTAFCAASAAVLNQLIERDADGRMARTNRRPLPTGRVSPTEAAWIGLAAGIIGVATLWLTVNSVTALLGLTTLVSYVAIYTPLKRLTTLNTIIGAIPGAIPPVMGWTAVTGSLTTQVWALFAILFVWQVPHFLAIATIYRDDYKAGGFKMLPVDDASLSATSRQILFFSAALIPASFLPSMLGLAGQAYLVAAIVLDAMFIYFAAHCAMHRTRLAARKLFLFSIIYLPVLLAIMMVDKL